MPLTRSRSLGGAFLDMTTRDFAVNEFGDTFEMDGADMMRTIRSGLDDTITGVRKGTVDLLRRGR